MLDYEDELCGGNFKKIFPVIYLVSSVVFTHIACDGRAGEER